MYFNKSKCNKSKFDKSYFHESKCDELKCDESKRDHLSGGAIFSKSTNCTLYQEFTRPNFSTKCL